MAAALRIVLDLSETLSKGLNPKHLASRSEAGLAFLTSLRLPKVKIKSESSKARTNTATPLEATGQVAELISTSQSS